MNWRDIPEHLPEVLAIEQKATEAARDPSALAELEAELDELVAGLPLAASAQARLKFAYDEGTALAESTPRQRRRWERESGYALDNGPQPFAAPPGGVVHVDHPPVQAVPPTSEGEIRGDEDNERG